MIYDSQTLFDTTHTYDSDASDSLGEGWFGSWFANGWFPSVWFAPADETHLLPEELRSAPDGVAPDQNTRTRYGESQEEAETKHLEAQRKHGQRLYSKEVGSSPLAVELAPAVFSSKAQIPPEVVAGLGLSLEDLDEDELFIVTSAIVEAL